MKAKNGGVAAAKMSCNVSISEMALAGKWPEMALYGGSGNQLISVSGA